MTIKQKIKLFFIKNSIEVEDKTIAYIRLDDKTRIKSRAVVETFFPGFIYSSTVVVEAEDGEFYIIKQKDIIQNYTAEKRYKKAIMEIEKENHEKYRMRQPIQGTFKNRI